MDEATIGEFWQAHPCGDVNKAAAREGYADFFSRYDAARYRSHPHLLRCLDEIDFAGKAVLEIGLGQGADSEQIIRRGGRWSGLDLTQESVDRVSARFAVRGLPYDRLEKGSVLALPFEAEAFDVVFSHGVLHHVPDIVRAQAEIARVLRPSGQLVAMLYAKISLNYLISIAALRRIGLIALYATGLRLGGVYDAHVAMARRQGLSTYLRLANFVHRNTDGPDNPYSKVYTRREVETDFPLFRIVRCHKEWMHAPPIPLGFVPGAHTLGWHLWVHMMRR